MDNKFQYHHRRNTPTRTVAYESTIAVKVPTKNELIDLIAYRNASMRASLPDIAGINLYIGSTRLNKSDNYVKAIGRELAVKYSSIETFFISQIMMNPDHVYVVLNSKDHKVCFRVNKNSDKVCFIEGMRLDRAKEKILSKAVANNPT